MTEAVVGLAADALVRIKQAARSDYSRTAPYGTSATPMPDNGAFPSRETGIPLMQKAVVAQTAMPAAAQSTVLPLLISLSFCHMLNDLMQSMIPALYPMIKDQFHLDFTQIGLIIMAFIGAVILLAIVKVIKGLTA